MKSQLTRLFPPLDWLQEYNRGLFASDLLAGIVVTVMLIPQSLAYALLAGLPAEMGLYASILPLAAYALFGSSRTLSVGPVAVASLMTATAVAKVAETGTADYASAAVALAMLSGLLLLGMGLLRFGFLANFLSHPVVLGFITASGIVIGLSQVRHILGIDAGGDNLISLGGSIAADLGSLNLVTLATGVVTLVFLLWARRNLERLLLRLGVGDSLAAVICRAGPIMVILATTLASYLLDFEHRGVAIVGDIPSGLPAFSAPPLAFDLWSELFVSALLISIIGFVESVSVGKTLAAKRRQRISPNQELIGLGASNVASSLTGGYPVTGGFARSVVNYDAGAETPAAGALTAVGIALATLLFTPLLYFLPKATLSATIIVAVLSLVDFSVLSRTWSYSRADFAAVAATIATTLLFGVEMGVSAGVLISIGLYLYKTSRPHIAEVGLVPGTEHFRNIKRHRVITSDRVLSIRVDESLYFANARYLEDYIYDRVAETPDLEHVILMCSAINEIDSSALESLETINQRLASAGVTLHLSEVKGPVMDRLKRSHFLDDLTGRIFLSQFAAASALDAGLSGNAATKKDEAALDGSTVHDREPTDDRNDAPDTPQGPSSKDPVSAT